MLVKTYTLTPFPDFFQSYFFILVIPQHFIVINIFLIFFTHLLSKPEKRIKTGKRIKNSGKT